MSVKLVSVNDVPVIVERTMWWPDGIWYESHNAPGSTQTGARWALAEGEVGGANGAQTYILIANTSAFAGEARVTVLLEGGGEVTRNYILPANSRTNVPVGADFPTTVEHALRHADRKPRRHARAARRRTRDVYERRRRHLGGRHERRRDAPGRAVARATRVTR